jgi:predicted AAA+ superfamily ATPase
VGKTTLFLDLANHFGEHAQYVAGDDPQVGLPGFWERTWSEAAQQTQHGSAVLLLDEVQHIADWGRRLKGQYDRLRRLRLPLHIAATGSSALRVGGASRESLAGRFERLTFTH